MKQSKRKKIDDIQATYQKRVADLTKQRNELVEGVIQKIERKKIDRIHGDLNQI